MKKLFLKIAGVFLILLGIIGLFLPFLQGFLFIFIGLSLLSPNLAGKARRAFFLHAAPGRLIRFHEWRSYNVSAGCTTRKWPVHLSSTGDLDHEETRQKIRGLWPDQTGPERLAYVKQVHGNRCVAVESADFKRGDFFRVQDADALVTVEKRTALLVLSADCLPIFYFVQKQAKAAGIALAHAGWKGTDRQIAAQTLECLLRRTNSHLADVRVALGVSIDGPHYEVGEEFRLRFPGSSLFTRKGKLCFDLRRENTRQLFRAGLKQNQIIDSGFSTVAHNRLFYSFRLEKAAAGRTLSYIYIL